MTLATCNKRLELATKKGDEKEVAFWTARIAKRLMHPKYAKAPKVEVETNGKKSKR